MENMQLVPIQWEDIDAEDCDTKPKEYFVKDGKLEEDCSAPPPRDASQWGDYLWRDVVYPFLRLRPPTGSECLVHDRIMQPDPRRRYHLVSVNENSNPEWMSLVLPAVNDYEHQKVVPPTRISYGVSAHETTNLTGRKWLKSLAIPDVVDTIYPQVGMTAKTQLSAYIRDGAIFSREYWRSYGDFPTEDIYSDYVRNRTRHNSSSGRAGSRKTDRQKGPSTTHSTQPRKKSSGNPRYTHQPNPQPSHSGEPEHGEDVPKPRQKRRSPKHETAERAYSQNRTDFTEGTNSNSGGPEPVYADPSDNGAYIGSQFHPSEQATYTADNGDGWGGTNLHPVSEEPGSYHNQAGYNMHDQARDFGGHSGRTDSMNLEASQGFDASGQQCGADWYSGNPEAYGADQAPDPFNYQNYAQQTSQEAYSFHSPGNNQLSQFQNPAFDCNTAYFGYANQTDDPSPYEEATPQPQAYESSAYYPAPGQENPILHENYGGFSSEASVPLQNTQMIDTSDSQQPTTVQSTQQKSSGKQRPQGKPYAWQRRSVKSSGSRRNSTN